MQRIMILRNCGAGKSTFAKKLSQINGLEIIHLDQQYYKPNWEGRNSDDWEQIVKELSSKPNWIMDGNYNPPYARIRAPKKVFKGVINGTVPWKAPFIAPLSPPDTTTSTLLFLKILRNQSF